MYGEAGHERPQDCLVKVRLKDAGGIEIVLSSKLENMFGTAMKESAASELYRLGVTDAAVEIRDFSSLDFVIRARTQTAVRRAGRCQNHV